MLRNWRKRTVIRAHMLLLQLTAQMVFLSSNRMKEVQAKSSCNIWPSIRELPFNLFLDFYIDGIYSPLIKDPENKEDVPDILQLVKLGEQIKMEFADASGGKDNSKYIRLISDIAKLENKLMRVNELINSYERSNSDELLQCLKEQGINGNTPEQMRVSTKRFELDLDRNKKALQAMAENSVEPPTRIMFDKILAQIDPKLRPEDITTFRYCTLYNTLKDKAKEVEKQQHGRRKGK